MSRFAAKYTQRQLSADGWLRPCRASWREARTRLQEACRGLWGGSLRDGNCSSVSGTHLYWVY